MSEQKKEPSAEEISRRSLLAGVGATGAGLAAFAAGAGKPVYAASAGPMRKGSGPPPRAPFDSMRDWVAALEANGLLMRFDRIDQDQYEIPGLFFRATDQYGMYGAPTMVFDELKVDGKWMKGPVLINLYGHWNTDAIVWNLPVVPGDHYATYNGAMAWLKDMLAKNGGKYPEIPPTEIARDKAPCKQVILKGDEIDLLKFPFLKTNPADGGRYVNTGSHFMVDPKLGPNFGTYRCEIKGPRTLGINIEPNQTGDKFLKAAQKRGEKVVKYSIVMGQDPMVWLLSGTRLAPRFTDAPQDELAIAGGMRGKPIDVVRSEDTDILIPAHAEFVIEGEVQLNGPFEDEGPFGEMFGYLGPVKHDNYLMTINTVTHRRDPWFVNAMTGMQRASVTAPMDAMYSVLLGKQIPNFVAYTNPQDTMGFVVMSIDKKEAGEGLAAGLKVAQRNPIAKVVVVVDKDVNILDRREVIFAIGSRWQPYPASKIIEDAFGLQTDPSQVKYARTSKIVIDATRQLPAEGGREVFPETNRALLEQGAPGIFEHVDKLYGEALRSWKRI